MSFIRTRCRLCTEEIRTKPVEFHDTDADHLKYKNKYKFLFEDLVRIAEKNTKTVCLPFLGGF